MKQMSSGDRRAPLRFTPITVTSIIRAEGWNNDKGKLI